MLLRLEEGLQVAFSIAALTDSSGNLSGSVNIDVLMAICVREDVKVARDWGKLKF